MTSRSSVICYFDIVSPYSYVGVKLLNRYKAQWKDIDVVLRPIFLHGIMTGSKNEPPATVAAKGAYMFQDLDRITKTAGIPFKFPSQFPVLTVSTMRLLIAIQKYEPSKYEQSIEKEEYWVNDKNVSQKDVLVNALVPIFGSKSKVEELYEMTSNKEIKQELIDNTQMAVDVGAFGAPTFIVKKAGSNEELMIFGSDRFELMTSLLGLPYPGLAPSAKL
ncbi:Glutathione S-transferase kappa 1 [Entomortierella lignicola]|nr:Glutathione S-transferase kappa 1 [Entomortierella lignicola]